MSGKKILVVEDSPTIRKVVSITLSQEGYEVIEAGDGLEALSRLNEAKPDLILLDIILPKMDGYQILSIIRENPEFKDIPVIMLSALSKKTFFHSQRVLDEYKGEKVPEPEAYIEKPPEPEELLDAIQSVLQ